MIRCFGRIVTVVALCCAIGLHWMALQSVAWTTMLIENSKHASPRQAIAQTFDGAHPCSICHLVNKGKASEKQSDVQSSTPKIDIIWVAHTIRLIQPFVRFDYAASNFSFSDIGHSPPVPPPRIS